MFILRVDVSNKRFLCEFPARTSSTLVFFACGVANRGRMPTKYVFISQTDHIQRQTLTQNFAKKVTCAPKLMGCQLRALKNDEEKLTSKKDSQIYK